MKKIVSYSINNPKVINYILLMVCLTMITLVTLPSIWPQTFTSLNSLQVDTDPENMLARDDPARIFHNKMKEEFGLYAIIVLGVVNETHPEGLFNV